MTTWIWLKVIFVLLLTSSVVQFVYYFWFTPAKSLRPMLPSRLDSLIGLSLYCSAYLFSLLRLPFAILPYCLKVSGVVIFKWQYQVSDHHLVIEALRVVGDFVNWIIGITIIGHLNSDSLAVVLLLYASIFAEMLRLVTEKGQMIISAIWQLLPHRRIAAHLATKFDDPRRDSVLQKAMHRYCHYYQLHDQERIEHVVTALRIYASADSEASVKLGYLSTLRIVASSHGLRGGKVRDVAHGEVYIHRHWSADPHLLIGQALRRAPWIFDPRYLRRPFYYRSEANRLTTLFVFRHARYCPTYTLYQFGHEIKSARYDLFYRAMRGLRQDIEPLVQADGTFPFDQGINWFKHQFESVPSSIMRPLWTEAEVILDIEHRRAYGESLSAIDIAEQYTFPLKFVTEVLWNKIQPNEICEKT